jgi:hypothetical protein
MTTKERFLVVMTVILLAVYVVFFTGWFKKQTIHISHTVRPTVQARRMSLATGVIIAFGFDHPLQLKEVSLVPLAQWQTNHFTTPLWHLVSDSNSAPVKFIVYGARVRGMKPAVAGSHPQPLTTNVVYRLLVTAGKIAGEHDFQIGPPSPSGSK